MEVEPQQVVRNNLSGVWILDKSRGQPSMRGYLETMGVHELAIEAHEKGDTENDTTHTITLTETMLTIKKLSRVNDLTMEVTLNKLEEKSLLDGRVKTTLATSKNPSHIKILTRMPTINGNATVTDIKTLLTNDVDVFGNTLPVGLKQELTITNEQTGNTHTTTRYFVPQQKVESSSSADVSATRSTTTFINNCNPCKTEYEEVMEMMEE